MKLIQTILFGVFLTGLVHVRISNSLRIGDFFTSDWTEFKRRLQTWIDTSDDLLTFAFKHHVIQDLGHCSSELTALLMKAETALSQISGTISPVVALKKTIDMIYDGLHERTVKNGDKLEKIKLVDPLGFDAYLRLKNDRIDGTLDIDECVDEYMDTLRNRVLLLHYLQKPSSIEDPKFNAGDNLNSIPEGIRKEIATEYAPVSEPTINYFIDIAAKQFAKTEIHRVKDLKQHDAKNRDGLRILIGGRVNGLPNWLCIKYDALSKQLHAYDNIVTTDVEKNNVQPIREDIINKLYPDKVGSIIYDKSKTPEADPASSGLYAIIYAATSLMGEDPAKIKFKLNDIYGDPCLYMRLHILKMFSSKKLSAMY